MASSRARSSDIKLIVSATLAVVLAGLFIAGAILVGTRGGRTVACGPLNIGSATDIRHRLEQGPFFQPGAINCGYWLAIANGNIVAYKVDQPENCPLQRKRDHWKCGSRTPDDTDLAQYPVSIRSVGQTDSVFVDLTPSSTTGETTG